MAGLEAMSANQLRKELVEKYDYSEAKVNKITSRNLLAIELQKAILNLEETENNGQAFFSELEEDEKQQEENTEIEDFIEERKLVPRIGSPSWQTYVLAHLQPGEYFEKNGNRYPKCAGLRRVAQVLLGEIVSSKPTQIFPPTPTGDVLQRGCAVVCYEVQIAWRNSELDCLVQNQIQEIRVFAEAADAWVGNTPDPFSAHLIATASSRAEGRAFKKALMLSVHTAEEMLGKDDKKEVVEQLVETNGEFNDDAPITGAQITNIGRLTKRLKIDTIKFITSVYPEHISLDNLTTAEGSSLCAVLNQYQSKGKDSLPIPEELKIVKNEKE